MDVNQLCTFVYDSFASKLVNVIEPMKSVFHHAKSNVNVKEKKRKFDKTLSINDLLIKMIGKGPQFLTTDFFNAFTKIPPCQIINSIEKMTVPYSKRNKVVEDFVKN